MFDNIYRGLDNDALGPNHCSRRIETLFDILSIIPWLNQMKGHPLSRLNVPTSYDRVPIY